MTGKRRANLIARVQLETERLQTPHDLATARPASPLAQPSALTTRYHRYAVNFDTPTQPAHSGKFTPTY